MPVYKMKDRNEWEVRVYDRDLKGKKKEVRKRCFSSKKEAKKWEAEYVAVRSGSMDMTFGEFVEKCYLPEIKPRIRPSTYYTKKNYLDKHIIPYFGHIKMSELETKHVILWQNEMMKVRNPKTNKTFTQSTLQSINEQLTAVLSWAVRYYDLPRNVSHIVGSMGSDGDSEMKIWTIDEFKRFFEVMKDEPIYYYVFRTLFFTAARVGEVLGLKWEDIDFKKQTIRINKTFYHLSIDGIGQDVIGPTKTRTSNRTIHVAKVLMEELKEYRDMVYKPEESGRVFPLSKTPVNRALKRGAEKAGLTPIRVHDIRHSAITHLIEMNYPVTEVGRLAGQKSMSITFRYAHSLPEAQIQMAKALDKIGREEEGADV